LRIKNKKISHLTTKYTLSTGQRCFHKTTNILGRQVSTYPPDTDFNHISRTQIRLSSNLYLAPYLAGLIEGDGLEKKEMKPLNPYFVTGFSDAESCFYVGVVKSSKVKVG
jgi:hypothetical protein